MLESERHSVADYSSCLRILSIFREVGRGAGASDVGILLTAAITV